MTDDLRGEPVALVADFQYLHRNPLRLDQCASNHTTVNVTTPHGPVPAARARGHATGSHDRRDAEDLKALMMEGLERDMTRADD